METRRLTFLLALARLESMRAVAEELGYTTSTVSQQLGVLAGEVGATLLEREGRRVRLTPAGAGGAAAGASPPGAAASPTTPCRSSPPWSPPAPIWTGRPSRRAPS